nr:substance-P receptor-like [Lytechinus pictus]XP_054767013.1 substance-P receptor-like [Lytechinus pictus]
MRINSDIFVGFLSLFSGLAILLNGATLIAIIASKNLRRAQNIFTFNIALGDFVASAVVAVQRWLDYWADINHAILTRILGAAMMVSILSTLAVAIHRFIIIRLDPFQNRGLVTNTRCIISCVFIWAAVFAVYLGTFLLNDRLFFYFISPIMLLCAIGICAIVYAFVYITISGSTRGIGLTSDAYLLRVKKNQKVLCTFVLVVCSNLVCWVLMCFSLLCLSNRPRFIYQYYPQYGRYGTANWFYNVYYIAWWLVNVNAVVNPIIYWTRLSDFRRLLFGCCGRRKDQESSPVTENSKMDAELDKGQNDMNMAIVINENENGCI